MELVKVAIIAITSAMAVLIIKKTNPELAVVLSISAGIMIMILILDSLFEVVYTFYGIADLTGIDSEIFEIILKIIGIGYISEFSASVCTDSGNKSIGDKVLLSGKIVIMLIALPIIKGIIGVIAEVLK